MSEVKDTDSKKAKPAKEEVKAEAKTKKAEKKPAKQAAQKKEAKKAKKSNAKPYMYDVVRSPIITEKSQIGSEYNKVTFIVAPDATKKMVKDSVEALFETKVVKVNIINVKGKTKRFRGTKGKRKDIKKAIVTLAEGQSIDVALAA